MPSSFSTSTSILSPAPISPFSPRTLSSSASHYTSDDLPDLGAFNTVLREWVHLQPYPRIPSHHRPDYQHLLHSHFDEEEGNLNDSGTEDRDTTGARSTVWNQRLIANYLHSGLSQVTRTNSGESDSEAASQSSDLGEDEEEDEEDEPEDEPDDEELQETKEHEEGEEDEDDTEGARTVEIADDDDDIAGEERDHDNTHLASVGSTTSPLRTQPSLVGDDDDDDREQDDDPGHEVPISHIGVGEEIEIDIDIDIDIGTNADTDASPSLGYLEEALSFIAAERERARWSALHSYGIGIGAGLREQEEEEGEWMHVIEHPPRRKKRRGRKRPVPVGEGLSVASDNYLNHPRIEGDGAEEEEADEFSRSRSTGEKPTISTPEAPAPNPPRSRSRRPKARLLNDVYAAYDSATTATTATATATATTSTTTSTVVAEPASPSTSKSSSTLKSTPRAKSKTTVTSLPTTPESKSLSSSMSRSGSTAKSKLKLKSTPTSTSTNSRPKLTISTQDDVTASRTGTGKGRSIFPYKIFTRSRSTPTLTSPPVDGDSEHTHEDDHLRVPSESETVGTKRASRRSRSRSPLPATSNGGRLPTHSTEKGGERVRLSKLVHVLKGVFPEDSVRLGEVEGKVRARAAGGAAEGELLDVRGRDPVQRIEGGTGGGDPLIHVFVDHSNILVGLLTYLKRHPPKTNNKAKEKENEGWKESKVLKPRPPKPRPPSISLGDPPLSPGILVVDDDSAQHDGDVYIDRDTTTPNTRNADGSGEYERDTTPGYPRGGSSTPGKRTANKDPKPTLMTAVKGASLTSGETKRSRPSSSVPVSAGESPTSPATSSASATQALKIRLGAGIGTTPIPLPSFATAGKSLRSGSGVTSPSHPRGDGAEPVHASSITQSLSKSPPTPNGSSLSRSKSLGHRPPGAFISESASTSNSGATAATSDANAFISSGDVRDRDRDGNGNEDGNDGDGFVNEKEIKMMRGGRNGEEVVLDGGDDHREQEQDEDENDDEDWEGDGEGERKAKKRQARRLSHTALALILERGRPITRRVLVTSSPLYQPMDTMERLGYEVRVYMRVPDLGDGMDRERYHHKHKDSTGNTSGSGGSPKKLKTHARRISGNTSAESASAGASTSTSAGEAAAKASKWSLRASLTFPESSNIPAPLHASAHSHPNSYAAIDHNVPGLGGLGRRIRYREQGVDELLQLKLHQALAATDDVPEGATIVLATGDGNVGQFSEDGFLGPVRTALRRGWKVELYAWEEGLSRAWRREFGEGSEWGRSGMFRIVGMEQFAESLVEGGL